MLINKIKQNIKIQDIKRGTKILNFIVQFVKVSVPEQKENLYKLTISII